MHFFEAIIPIFTVGVFWWAIVAIIRSTQDFRLRKAMVQQGLSTDEIKSLFHRPNSIQAYPNLKWGMVLAGIGIAVLVGGKMEDETLTAGLIILFAGIGYLIYFMVTKKFQDREIEWQERNREVSIEKTGHEA